MPIYEYSCRACGIKSSLFIRSMSAPVEPRCCQCESSDMQRAISTFTYPKSLTTTHQEYGPPPGPGVPSMDYYKDPRNVGRHVEESFQKYGVEMPQSVRDNIDAARQGELPEGLDL